MLCRPILSSMVRKASKTNTLRILGYHRVKNVAEESYPFDEDLISASAENFEKQMRFVSGHFNVVTFAEMNDLIRKGSPLPANALVITFDDGYDDNYRIAFPILKDNGLRAVFFISTDYIGKAEPFWFEKIVYLYKKGLIERVGDWTPAPFRQENGTTPLAAFRLHLMKMTGGERDTLLKRIEEKAGFHFGDGDLQNVLPMTWAQVREMADAGMEIGSHTRSHSVLGCEAEEQLENELRGSKEIIEREIGREVLSISYPVASKPFALSDRVIQATREADYRWAVTNLLGVQDISPGDALRLKRLRIERYMSFDWFKAQLLLPELFTYNS